MLKKLCLILIGLLILTAGARAAGVITPVKAVVNPLSQAVYVPANTTDPATIRVYTRLENPGASIYGWDEHLVNGSAAIELSSKEACYGLAVSPDGKKLYISINDWDGVTHKLRSYDLDSSGRPVLSSKKDFSWNWALETQASPGGIVALGHVVYMADQGAGRIHMFYPSTGKREGNIILTNQALLYDIAVTPPQITSTSISYWLLVLQKGNPGNVYVYYSSWPTGQSPTHTYVGKITNLKFPTNLKISPDGKYAYISVNGGAAGDPDVEVYEISQSLPPPYFKLAAKVNSGVTGSYGWTGLDISLDNNYLLHTQQNADNTVTLYQTPVSSLKSANGSTVTASQIKNVMPLNADSIVISSDGKRCGSAFSANGSLYAADDPWLTSHLSFLAPTVTAITPSATSYNNSVNVTITGKNFRSGGIANLAAYLETNSSLAKGYQSLNNITVISPEKILATVPSYPAVKAGIHDVLVDNCYLGVTKTYTGKLTQGFTIYFTATTSLSGEARDTGGTGLASGQVRWAWDFLNQGEEGYKLYDANTNTLRATLTKNDNSFIEQNLNPNALYKRYIVAYNNALNSPKSNTVTTYSSAAIPAVVSTSNITASSVTVSWEANNNPGGTQYVVSRHIRFTSGPFVDIGTSGATSFTDTQNLVAGKEYTYLVRAKNAVGVETLNSQAAFAVIPGGTGQVDIINLAIKRDGDIANTSTITLNWQTNPSNQAVDIWYKDVSFETTGWSKLQSVSAGTTSYTDPGLKVGDGTTRFYKIMAAGAASVSADDLTQEVAAKFDIGIREGNNNLFSLPAIGTDTIVDTVIGAQLQSGSIFGGNGDRITYYDPTINNGTGGYLSAALSSTTNKWTGWSGTPSLEADKAYLIERKTGNGNKYITITGKLFPGSTRNINLSQTNLNMFGSLFPTSVSLANSNLGSVLTPASSPFSQDGDKVNTYIFDSSGGEWVTAAYVNGQFLSTKLKTFDPGKGYYITNKDLKTPPQPDLWIYTKK